MAEATAGFHLMAKPSGPACNLDCTYCFYLEKEALFPRKETRRMSDAVLDAYVRETIAATPASQPVLFAWQGGEPTLLGIPFYQRALELQQRYGAGRKIENSFQTNGTLIDEDWARFLADNAFLVGLSLDGPQDIHDHHRRYRSGAPSHHLVMAALERLQRHGVAYNVLACVDRNSSRHPQTTYRWLKAQGVEYIQFTPIIERLAGADYAAAGFTHEGPSGEEGAGVAPFTVRPREWGKFLATVFDEWRRKDVGRVFVMNFEWTLAALVGAPGVVCVHQPECGRALVVEHDGEVYSCDHFVYPDHALGRITETPLAAMVESTRQHAFGQAKRTTLPGQCQACPQLELCWGGCPKHRFLKTRDGEPGLNWLCDGYLHYLGHARPWLETIAALLAAGRDPREAMALKRPSPTVAG
ncbi:MAG: anaerobic sulfatase maturase [Sphingomonadales bacterium]|nr:anaerobic sulfatase maturase [Sphingomonadales bacterium]